MSRVTRMLRLMRVCVEKLIVERVSVVHDHNAGDLSSKLPGNRFLVECVVQAWEIIVVVLVDISSPSSSILANRSLGTSLCHEETELSTVFVRFLVVPCMKLGMLFLSASDLCHRLTSSCTDEICAQIVTALPMFEVCVCQNVEGRIAGIRWLSQV